MKSIGTCHHVFVFGGTWMSAYRQTIGPYTHFLYQVTAVVCSFLNAFGSKGMRVTFAFQILLIGCIDRFSWRSRNHQDNLYCAW